MADKGKIPGRSSNRGSSSSGTPNLPRELHTRSDITALIGGSNGPVNNVAEARTWLDKQGWVLSGEKYDRSKLVDILLTVSLLPKLPADAAAAIRAVAFLTEDKLDDDISSTLAQATADKFLTLIGNIPDVLAKAKDFLEATSTQQANTTVELRETATQHATTTNNLVEITTKLTTEENTRSNAVPQWPSIRSSHPSPPTLPSPNHNPAVDAQDVRLQQRLLLGARTVLIEVDPLMKPLPKIAPPGSPQAP